ncbi:hypothetical protein D3C71_1132500 [compost metagenome]
MGIRQDITAEVEAISQIDWNVVRTREVPRPEDVPLGSGAKSANVTMLYADLADSTRLSMLLPPEALAEITKSFLVAACRTIRFHGGHIRSFDGDRVMGVFIGDGKGDRAFTAALELTWYVEELIKPRFIAKYPLITAAGLDVAHGVGIDAGEVFVARTGIRRHNDLVWVGRAPNIAAKLSAIRVPSLRIFATLSALMDAPNLMLSPDYANPPREVMWQYHNWTEAPAGFDDKVVATAWWFRRSVDGA